MPDSHRKASPAAVEARGGSGPTLREIALGELRFDPANPRVTERLGPKPSQDQIRDLLLNEMEARDLIPSFIANGFLPYEPLIVRPVDKGRHLVLEGNRRLAALQSMATSDDVTEQRAFHKWKLGQVACIIFQGSGQEELAYLGLRHLSKTKDWAASAKAAFVERLLKSGMTLAKAGQITNTSPQALRQLLLTRRLFERAAQLGMSVPQARAEGEILFWHLGDAVRRVKTKTYLELIEADDPMTQPELNETRFERLVTWIYGSSKTGDVRLIRSIRDIPLLDTVLGHRASTRALERGASLQDALEEAQAAGHTVATHLDRAKKSIQRATGLVSDIRTEDQSEVESARSSLDDAVTSFDTAYGVRSKKKHS